MSIRIIADSSANLPTGFTDGYVSVPLTILAGEDEFIDNESLNLEDTLSRLKKYRGKSSTACPGIGEWTRAFGDADIVLGVAITGHLSGCYNSARIASNMYMDKHPGRKVFIIDSLSTGPEMELLVEKCVELASSGLPFEEMEAELKAYHEKTHLSFSLASLSNFAKNGRVNPALAKIVETLNIRIVGIANEIGDLDPLHKCRGERSSIEQIWKDMTQGGYAGGKVRLRHTENPAAAEKLRQLITLVYPDADIQIGANRALCSYYAEPGSLLVGYEA